MSIIRTITEAFRGEFGKRPARNPWARCDGCYRPTAPAGLCDECGLCGDCCLGHPKDEKDET